MNEERKQILQMLADGKVTPEQAGELLDVLEDQPVAAGAQSSSVAYWPRWEPRSRSREGRYATLNRLAEARAHGVTPDFLREMADLGYSGLTLRELIALRNYGVTPEYIRELGHLELGDLSIEEITRLRAHGVDPTFVREIRDLGFEDMSVADLCMLRDHGVDAHFMRQMRDLGLLDLTPEQVMEMRIQGLTHVGEEPGDQVED
jgi:hypothetical protein